VIAPFFPGMSAWGVNGLRFLPPLAWSLAIAAVLALVSPFAARGVPAARALGEAIRRRPLLAAFGFGGVLALGVLAFPDHTRFVGDFLMRQGTVEEAMRPGVLFPQALPLDVLLHYRIPLALSDAHLLVAGAYGRVLGALEAFALGALAVAFARALALEGPAACVAACAVAFTGALGLMTGYSKAFSELALVTLAVAVFGTRVAREGRGVAGLGLATAIALALHRSALALLPAAVVALALAARDPRLRPRLVRPAALAGYAALGLALVLFLPTIVRTATSFDVTQHFASEDVVREGGLLAAAFGGRRLLDLLNVFAFLTPLAPLVLFAALGGIVRERATAVLLALFGAWFGVAFVVFPAQGVFRDWDVFAASGVATAALAAWACAHWIADSKARAPLAVSVSVACIALTALGLWLPRDRARGWSRVEAFVAGPPARTAVERAKTWDYLGASWYQAGRYADAARAFGHAAETSRSQRIYLQWASAAHDAGDAAGAQRVLEELVGFSPGTGLAWQMLGSIAWQRGDYAAAANAARGIAKLVPGDAEVAERARYVERFYEAWKDSVEGRSALGPHGLIARGQFR
jgi:tetratricopeptide (TPR) repeat protein